jgi:hypothetical protein
MQIWLKTVAAAAITLSVTTPVAAQYTDTTGVPVYPARDTVPSLMKWNSIERRPAFPLNGLIIPAGMVAYGVTGLHAKMLQSVNEKISEEVAVEHPHKEIRIDNFLQFAPALAVYGLNAMGVKGKHNFKDRTILYSMSMLIAYGTTYSIKRFSNEMRPDGSDMFSFPSGHTTNAFVAAEFMRQEYKDVSPWYGVAGYAVAATTGYLRMYNNKHWFGDVVAGAGIGIASTKIAYWLYPVLQRSVFKKNKHPNTVVMPTYQDGAVGFGLVHKF